MLAKLTFLGAARNVTGSCYLLESQNTRVLIDCGMYQERKYQERNWQPFPFAPQSIDAVFLTMPILTIADFCRNWYVMDTGQDILHSGDG